MAKPRLDLRSKKDRELQSFGESVIRAMRASDHFAAYQAQVEAAATEVQDYTAALAGLAVAESNLRAATVLKQAERTSLEKTLTALAALVTMVSAGREEVVSASAMELRRRKSRIGHLPAPGNLVAEGSEFEGACELMWEIVHGTSVYEVEFKLHGEAEPWQRFTSCTTSKCRVTGLTPGEAYYFRVRAIGSAGPGAWSDPALKRAS
jgi:hypothetical protein